MQQLGQTRLEKRRFALGEEFDLGAIVLDPDDVVAQPRHAGSMNGAQVTATDDRDFQRFSHQPPAMAGQESARTLQEHSRHIPPATQYCQRQRRRVAVGE
jgi:hypothetical protein